MMRPLVVSSLMLATGCVHGTRPENFPPAIGPEGVQVALHVRGETRDRVGELLAADNSGLTIRDPGIIRVAWDKIAALDVAGLGSDFDVQFGETASAEKRARLALVSRFPQGME